MENTSVQSLKGAVPPDHKEEIMQISSRVEHMSEPALLKFYPMVDEAKEKGKKFYYLNIGQPDIETPKEFMDMVKRRVEGDEKVLSYAEPEGVPILREKASHYFKRFGLDFPPKDILVTNGGSEALLFTFLTVCNPGDEILTPVPLYSVYKEMASAASVKLTGIMTYAKDGFKLPEKKEIEKLITDKTKAILITNPNNPTGKVMSRREIEDLKDLCIRYGLYFISDEVYREFIYDDLEYISPGQDRTLDEETIIIDSISKRFSACGARIGFILSKNEAFVHAVRKLCQMRLAVSSVDQLGAAKLFDLDTSFFDHVIHEYESRRDTVFNKFENRKDIIAKKPTGAFYYVLKLPVKDAEPFIEWMIRDFDDNGESVVLTPANDFYLNPENGKDEVRLAYVLNNKDLERASDVLLNGLEAYKKAHPENIKEEFLK